MNIEDFNNKVLIINDGTKESLVKLLSGKLLNIKLITLSELKKKYYFDYDKESIYFICKKYNVNHDIAKIYLDNLYYISEIDNEKIRLLKEIKNELDSNNLLTYNPLFKDFLNNNKVVLFNVSNCDKFYKNIFNELNNVEEYNTESKSSVKDLYKALSYEEEISFVASKICELIKSGININNIKLANVNSGNTNIIKRIFKLFNIPVNLESDSTIEGVKLVKVFKENYNSDISKTIEEVEKYVKTKKDNEVFKQLINIVNSYSFIKDYMEVKELLFNDIDNTKIKSNKYSNSVKVIDFKNEIINDDDYVFLVNYNEGIIPINYKDEEYLNDELRTKCNISTSFELNKIEEEIIKNRIKSINNLIVTYSKYDSQGEIYISSSYDSEMFNNKDINISLEHSDIYNKLRLVSLLDDNKKYGTISDELVTLYNHYKDIDYSKYSNKYTKIDKDSLYEYMDKKLVLSYTSLNSYNECAFKYYLSSVLRLDQFKSSFEATIGNIFHHILAKCFEEGFDFESSWTYEIENCKYEFNNMENYFVNLLKKELILVIETIKNQLKYTSLTKNMYEKEIIIDINKDLHITFKGFVDKIMYNEFDGETIVAIVDYKTGNPNININNIKYGLDMQLPIYMYLIKNSNIVKNVRIGGFYLQKILNNEKTIEDRINGLKLQGYSNSDEDILSKVDSSYKNSNIIKSMKVGNNGFYKYSKVLTDDNFDYLSSLVDKKIKETSNKILDAEFDINPKMIKGKDKSCNYCNFKDICYMRNEDIVNLEEVKDIFGGEE